MIKRALRKTLIIVVSIVFITCGALFLDGYSLYNQAKNQMDIDATINSIRAKDNYTKITELPQSFTDAVIAAEDHSFYQHGPIDISAIIRAVFVNIKDMSPREGGSTITQQVAKNMFFTQEKLLRRKVAEALMAFDLEKILTKDEILELYINTNFYGNGYTGVKDAARGYYQKEPAALTLAEATMLAGIPNAPSVYAPTNNLELAKQRQKQVIAQMVEYGFLTQEEADAISF